MTERLSTCPFCNGTKLYKDKPCKFCKGTGAIRKNEILNSMKETTPQLLILHFLEEIGIEAYKINVGRRGIVKYGGKKSMADIIANFHGTFLAIEVKRPGEVPRPDQAEYLATVNESGGIGIWADSLDMAREKLLKHAILHGKNSIHLLTKK